VYSIIEIHCSKQLIEVICTTFNAKNVVDLCVWKTAAVCDVNYFRLYKGMAADVGTLQRLPRVIGSESLVRELAFTARKMMASEAKECGFISRVYDDKER